MLLEKFQKKKKMHFKRALRETARTLQIRILKRYASIWTKSFKLVRLLFTCNATNFLRLPWTHNFGAHNLHGTSHVQMFTWLRNQQGVMETVYHVTHSLKMYPISSLSEEKKKKDILSKKTLSTPSNPHTRYYS